MQDEHTLVRMDQEEKNKTHIALQKELDSAITQ
jgi:hypothetical protein